MQREKCPGLCPRQSVISSTGPETFTVAVPFTNIAVTPPNGRSTAATSVYLEYRKLKREDDNSKGIS